MALIAAFHWDSTNKEISHFIFDDVSFKNRAGSPNRYAASTEPLAKSAIDGFFLALQNLTIGGIVEYKIVNHASPVTQHQGPIYKPHPLTTFVDKEFLTGCKGVPNWVVQQPVRSLLTGDALKKFKAGLKDLQLWNSPQGAFVAHIWTIALHATDSTHKAKLKLLWKSIKGLSRATAENRKLFQKWYEQLS
jgi:hypothetical protein